MEHRGLLIKYMDDGSVKTEELSKNILRKNKKPLYIVTNQNSREYVLYTTLSRESEDTESKENVGKECSAKRKHQTCRACGSSLPHGDGQKLSKDCLIEETPDQISKTWSKKVMDWVEDRVHMSLKEPEDVQKDTRRTARHLKSFYYGISTKLFSVESDCEVRLHLSREEISRLSFNYNLIGFIVSHLASEEYMEYLSSFLQKNEDADVLQEISLPAGYYFCCSDRNQRTKYLEDLQSVLDKKIRAVCSRLGDSIGSFVCGALVALVAAELASTHGRAQSFDDEEEDAKRCPKQPEMKHQEKYEKMVREFDEKTDLKIGVRWTKKIYSFYRNKSLNGWVRVGKKHLQSRKIFTFGLCLKNFSISGDKWQIQLFQNYEDTHSLASSFHFMAFAMHLMMFREWRMKLDILQKDMNQREDVIQEISELASRFFCGKSDRRDAFRDHFQEEMKENCKTIQKTPLEAEGLCVMGMGMVVLGALSALSINTRTMDHNGGMEEEYEITEVDCETSKKVQEKVVADDKRVGTSTQAMAWVGVEELKTKSQKNMNMELQETVSDVWGRRGTVQHRRNGKKGSKDTSKYKRRGPWKPRLEETGEKELNNMIDQELEDTSEQEVRHRPTYGDSGELEENGDGAEVMVFGGKQRRRQQEENNGVQESVEGSDQKDVAPTAKGIGEGDKQEDGALSAREGVCGADQEAVVNSTQDRVEGDIQEDVAAKAQEGVDDDAQEAVASAAQESVEGDTQEDMAPSAQGSIDGADKEAVASSAQNSVESVTQEDKAPSAQDSVNGADQENVAPNAQKSVDGADQEDVAPSAQESVDGSGKEHVGSTAQKGVDHDAKEAVASAAQNSIDGGAQEAVLSAQEGVDGGQQEEMVPGAHESVDSADQENVALSPQKSVDGGDQEDVDLSAQEDIGSIHQKAVVFSAQEGVDHDAQEAMALAAQDSVDGGAQEAVLSAQKSVDDGAQAAVAPCRQDSVEVSAQEDVLPIAQEGLHDSIQETVAPGAHKVVQEKVNFEKNIKDAHPNIDAKEGATSTHGESSTEADDGAHPQTQGGTDAQDGAYSHRVSSTNVAGGTCSQTQRRSSITSQDGDSDEQGDQGEVLDMPGTSTQARGGSGPQTQDPPPNTPSRNFLFLKWLDAVLLKLILLIILLLIVSYVYDISCFEVAVKFRVRTKNQTENMPPF